MKLIIERAWDGGPLLPGEGAELELGFENDGLRVDLRAPYFGDPPPPAPPGPTDGLWDHEVVELFVRGADDHYLEVEVGPHGHYLVLQLEGRRNVVAKGLEIACEVHRNEDRWTAELALPRGLLPPGPHFVNAYAIHGWAPARRYLAWRPVPGEQPDFHRLDCFEPLKLPGLG